MKLPGEFFLWDAEQYFFAEFLHLALVALHTTFFPLTPLGVTARPNRNLSWTTSKTVSVLIATVCMAPLSASEALAISALSWSKWTTALLLNSKRTRCQWNCRKRYGRE